MTQNSLIHHSTPSIFDKENKKKIYLNERFCVARLISKDKLALSNLFKLIAADPAAKNFHPHPFTKEYVQIITEYKGRDLYLGAFLDKNLIGYGLLRGWDTHYKIPSLGIYLAPTVRGHGWSIQFMHALHQYALKMNASSIRLKVYAENSTALNLYKKIGYVFTAKEQEQLVGYINLLPEHQKLENNTKK